MSYSKSEKKAYHKEWYRRRKELQINAKEESTAKIRNFLTNYLPKYQSMSPSVIAHLAVTKKAKLAELLFAIMAYSKDWQIATPIDNMVPYDFVIRRNRKFAWETVQVKCSYVDQSHNRRRVRVKLYRNKANEQIPYKKDDFDLLAVFSPEKTWLIPSNVLKNLRQIQVDQPKYDEFLL